MMKRATGLLVIFFVSCSLGSRAAGGQSAAQGWAFFKQGRYEEAVKTFNTVLQTESGNLKAQTGLLRAYLETGQYEKAEQATAQFLADLPDNGQLINLRGELRAIRGRYDEALDDFQSLADKARGRLARRAKLNAGLVLTRLGKVEKAQRLFRQFIANSNSQPIKRAEDLTLTARAVTSLQQYHDANNLYLDAIAADPGYIDADLYAGDLYLETYTYAEAASFFREALKINPNSARAHLGLARSHEIDGGPAVTKAIDAALKINPNFVEARNVKASVHLNADRFDQALEELDRSLKVNPNSLEAHSLRAAVHFLQHRPDEFQSDIEKTLAINPRYGELYHTLAETAMTHRLYHQAVEFAQKAVQLSPRLWKAHATLGINLLRINQYVEGRKALETAFKGDPFNLWTKNTLDLLDSMRDFRQTIGKHVLVKIAAKENDVIAPYALTLFEEAYRTLSAKYHFTPRGPIVVEIFPNHEDFAVRTLGLPGLGALGVCFGQVIAMDSPSARRRENYNWGSTAWHEFAHVITLQITDYRVPRWFSEGLSVYEERRARPGWGDDWTLGYLKAFIDGRFLPIAELDSGFLRPTTPDQLPLSYFQASLICEFIEHRFGFDAIPKMLRHYKQNATTAEVLRQVLGLSPGEFDKDFRAYVNAKTAGYRKAIEFDAFGHKHREMAEEALRAMLLENPDSFFAHWRLGLRYKSEAETAKAIEHLNRAIELFPYYTKKENPYRALTDVYLQHGQPKQAIAVLERLVNIDENNDEAHNQLAWLLVEQGEVARATAMLDRCVYINPFDVDWHTRAGEFFLQHHQAARAVREFQVALALDPVDKAQAQYNLARALLARGQTAEAKRAVLRSLEIAPGFEKAQHLLLTLTGQL